MEDFLVIVAVFALLGIGGTFGGAVIAAFWWWLVPLCILLVVFAIFENHR